MFFDARLHEIQFTHFLRVCRLRRFSDKRTLGNVRNRIIYKRIYHFSSSDKFATLNSQTSIATK